MQRVAGGRDWILLSRRRNLQASPSSHTPLPERQDLLVGRSYGPPAQTGTSVQARRASGGILPAEFARGWSCRRQIPPFGSEPQGRRPKAGESPAYGVYSSPQKCPPNGSCRGNRNWFPLPLGEGQVGNLAGGAPVRAYRRRG